MHSGPIFHTISNAIACGIGAALAVTIQIDAGRYFDMSHNNPTRGELTVSGSGAVLVNSDFRMNYSGGTNIVNLTSTDPGAPERASPK